jgi:hypothetical protein
MLNRLKNQHFIYQNELVPGNLFLDLSIFIKLISTV